MDQAHVKHVYNEMKYAFRKADEAEKFLFHAVMMMGKRNRIRRMKAQILFEIIVLFTQHQNSVGAS